MAALRSKHSERHFLQVAENLTEKFLTLDEAPSTEEVWRFVASVTDRGEHLSRRALARFLGAKKYTYGALYNVDQILYLADGSRARPVDLNTLEHRLHGEKLEVGFIDAFRSHVFSRHPWACCDAVVDIMCSMMILTF